MIFIPTFAIRPGKGAGIIGVFTNSIRAASRRFFFLFCSIVKIKNSLHLNHTYQFELHLCRTIEGRCHFSCSALRISRRECSVAIFPPSSLRLVTPRAEGETITPSITLSKQYKISIRSNLAESEDKGRGDPYNNDYIAAQAECRLQLVCVTAAILVVLASAEVHLSTSLYVYAICYISNQ